MIHDELTKDIIGASMVVLSELKPAGTVSINNASFPFITEANASGNSCPT